jgi:ribose 1,5-bisphosphokinase PhnN
VLCMGIPREVALDMDHGRSVLVQSTSSLLDDSERFMMEVV